MSLSSNWLRKMLSPSENVGSNPASDVALKDCGVIVQAADPCYWCSLSAFLDYHSLERACLNREKTMAFIVNLFFNLIFIVAGLVSFAAIICLLYLLIFHFKYILGLE